MQGSVGTSCDDKSGEVGVGVPTEIRSIRKPATTANTNRAYFFFEDLKKGDDW